MSEGDAGTTAGRLVVVGAGEIGGAVAAAWAQGGGQALAVTRTERRHAALARAGVPATTRDPRDLIGSGDRVLLSVAGSQGQAEVVEGLQGVECRRAVFTSTTGVYGAPAGPVDAGTPAGSEPRARAAWAAEAAFRTWCPGGVILRLGGLYRLGRGPVQALLRRGAPLPGPPDRTLALIHQDDAVTAIVAALCHPAPEAVYLAVTPPLPTRRDFYRAACARHGLAPPTFTGATGRAPAEFDVGPLRRDLLPDPAHPDWREALEA